MLSALSLETWRTAALGAGLTLLVGVTGCGVVYGVCQALPFDVVGVVAVHWERRRREYIRSRRPKTITLVRHGESEANVDRLRYSVIPDCQLNLTAKGIQQAKALGRKLKEQVGTEKVYFIVSPFTRTRQTLAGLLEAFESDEAMLSPELEHSMVYDRVTSSSFSDAPYYVREDPRIRELEWGNFQPSSSEEMDEIAEERKRVSRFYYRFNSGESGADVYDRVSDFLSSLFRDMDQDPRPFQFQHIVIVTHSLTMRMFLMRYFRWSVDDFESILGPSNCETYRLTLDDNGYYKLSDDTRLRFHETVPTTPGVGSMQMNFFGSPHPSLGHINTSTFERALAAEADRGSPKSSRG